MGAGGWGLRAGGWGLRAGGWGPRAGAGIGGWAGRGVGTRAGVLRLEPDFLKLGVATGADLNLVFVTRTWFWVALNLTV